VVSSILRRSKILLGSAHKTLGKTCIPVGTPSLLMRLITQVTSLDTSSMLLKRFPRSGFFNFEKKSNSFGLSPQDFGQVLYSCRDAFVVDDSDYSCHLIRHLLKASEAFPTEWFLRNKSKSGGLSPTHFDLFPKLKKPPRGKRFRRIEEVSNEVT
jgi:hypothetical protein